MSSEYSDEQIEKLKLVNKLLTKALGECERVLRNAESATRITGQDNDPRDATPASPPSA